MTAEDVVQQALPFGTGFLNKLPLFHPGTWWQLYKPLSVWYEKDFDAVFHGLVGILLPAVMGGLLRQAFFASSTVSPMLITAAYVLSPWTMSNGNAIYKGMQQPSSVLAGYIFKRAITEPDAFETFKQQLERNRVRRCRGYDVYLPPNTTNVTNQNKALLLIPGALVGQEAYCEVATKLSNHGLVVVVVSCEPTRLADFLYSKKIRRVTTCVENEVSKDHPAIMEWAICGHSLGARQAVELGVKLGIRKIIMWGYPFFVLPQFSTIDATPGTKLCVIQGENDPGVSNLSNSTKQRETLESFQAFTKGLPHNSEQTIIAGGNHQFFGSYTPRFLFQPPEADRADITREEQHFQLARVTAEFVLAK